MQKYSKSISFILLAIALFCWIAAPVLAFFNIETTTKATLITVIVVAGEVAFVGSMLLGGKVIWEKTKDFFKGFFTKKLNILDEK
jgi:hypothetical protein